ncbi:TetR/AcrR family transcriptional regulator [Nocardia sp. NPDC059177]|uniref:TetR/AcrR family transcriptional regulator n=1 Tax=Nocardia sp. NPDC059177 TaxID=3346759 RepID=UPI0036B93B28
MHGYVATTTDTVAARSGVSQAYVIRLFGTKQRLFLMALDHAWDLLDAFVRESWPRSLHRTDTQHCVIDMLSGSVLPMLLHGFAQSSDPAVCTKMRDRCAALYEVMRSHPQASVVDIRRFLTESVLVGALATLT